MQVILRGDVDGLGHKGDIITVADGYGRNYLLPRGLALLATKGAAVQAAAMQRARVTHDAEDREAAEALAGRLTGLQIAIPARASDEGHLFGSVTGADVAAVLTAELGTEIDRQQVRLTDPVKTIGSHEIAVDLHAEVQVGLMIEVTAES